MTKSVQILRDRSLTLLRHNRTPESFDLNTDIRRHQG